MQGIGTQVSGQSRSRRRSLTEFRCRFSQHLLLDSRTKYHAFSPDQKSQPPSAHAACSAGCLVFCANRSARILASWKSGFRLRTLRISHYSTMHLVPDNLGWMSWYACRVTAPQLEPTRVSKACRRRDPLECNTKWWCRNVG